jgi:hypothetical protein
MHIYTHLGYCMNAAVFHAPLCRCSLQEVWETRGKDKGKDKGKEVRRGGGEKGRR